MGIQPSAPESEAGYRSPSRSPLPGVDDAALPGAGDDDSDGYTYAQLPMFSSMPAQQASPKTKKKKRRHSDDSDGLPTSTYAQLPMESVAQLPSAAVSSPAGPKRRLPIDVPDANPVPSSSAPKKRRTKAKGKAARISDALPSSSFGDGPSFIAGDEGQRTGKFIPSEIAQVEQAVEAFRTKHILTDHKLRDMIHMNPQALKQDSKDPLTLQVLELWDTVEASCPSRKRRALLSWTRQRYHNFVARATWTPEQDDEVRAMVEEHDTKWSLIGKLINRHPSDVRDRWRNYLINGTNQIKQAWNDDEEKQLISRVAEALRIIQADRQANPDSGFYDGKTDEELIDWNVLSKKMNGARSRLQCQHKWRRLRLTGKLEGTEVYPLLDSTPHYRLIMARKELRGMKQQDIHYVVTAIHDSEVENDKAILWKEIIKSSEKKFQRRTGQILWHRLRGTVPDNEKKTTQTCAEALLSMFEASGRFNMLSDDEVDDAVEEGIVLDLPRGTKGAAKESIRRASLSQEMAFSSHANPDGESADDGDSNWANFNATSPAPDSAPATRSSGVGDQGEEDDQASVDLANDAHTTVAAPGHDDRAGSVDLSLDAGFDKEGGHDDGRERRQDKPSPSPRKTKGKGKEVTSSQVKARLSNTYVVDGFDLVAGNASPELPNLPSRQAQKETPSPVRKTNKRKSRDTGIDPSEVTSGSPMKSRKKARTDVAATPSEVNGTKQPLRKRKAATRLSGQIPKPAVEAAPRAPSVSSSDSDVEGIPPRLRASSLEL